MAQDAPGQMNDTYIAPGIDDDWLWERRCTALRSGLIREFNETRAEHLRIIRCEIPAHEEIYGFHQNPCRCPCPRCAIGSIPTGSAVAGSSSSSPKARVQD